jgi:hypothetical protein
MRKQKNDSGDSKLDGIPKKIQKILADDLEWLEKAQQFSKQDIDKEIVICNEVIVDLAKDMDADQHLNEIKEQKKEAEAVYKSGLKINNARVAYLVALKRSI